MTLIECLALTSFFGLICGAVGCAVLLFTQGSILAAAVFGLSAVIASVLPIFVILAVGGLAFVAEWWAPHIPRCANGCRPSRFQHVERRPDGGTRYACQRCRQHYDLSPSDDGGHRCRIVRDGIPMPYQLRRPWGRWRTDEGTATCTPYRAMA